MIVNISQFRNNIAHYTNLVLNQKNPIYIQKSGIKIAVLQPYEPKEEFISGAGMFELKTPPLSFSKQRQKSNRLWLRK